MGPLSFVKKKSLVSSARIIGLIFVGVVLKRSDQEISHSMKQNILGVIVICKYFVISNLHHIYLIRLIMPPSPFATVKDRLSCTRPGIVTTTKWPMTNSILFFWLVVKCV